jgi:hypothetical protein
MPRSPALPRYRLHRASGRAVVTLNYKDFYLGPYNSAESHREYDRLLAEWIANGRQLPQAIQTRTLTINQLLAAYLQFAKQYYSLGTPPCKEYIAMKYAAKPLRALYGTKPITEFGPLALKAIREQIVAADICLKQVNARINRIRRIFKWGVENELVPVTVLHALQAVAPLKIGRTSSPETEPVKPS